MYFDAHQRSDQAPSVVLAELVREQILARTREEVPHAVEVEVNEITHPHADLVRIEAVVLTETESQKGILIGAGGRMIKSIGIAARRTIERELGSRVHLELSVRVRRHWRADERVLDRLGIE
jgi:GTP-binding protein Era